MHELGIVFHIIKEVKAVAAQNACSKVNKVVMDIGEVSTVVPYYLEDCWKWAVAREDSLMKDCRLEVNVLEAVTRCDACSKEYSTVKHAKICPYCGSEETFLLRGNEVEIKEIEVE